MLKISRADRLDQLPPYLFVEIDKAKKKARAEGRDMIDLGIGDPDKPTPDFIIESMRSAVADPANHSYPLDSGLSEMRTEIAAWYKRRFDVELDAATEVLPLIGSKEGIAHAPFAYVNPGDVALVPDPGYPPYRNATILAGGIPESMPLLNDNDFLPDLGAVSAPAADKAKIMFLNYPNNPTSACASSQFFKDVVSFASDKGVMVLHDAAYTELSFDGSKPQSFLETKGAKDVGIEFHSLSKTYNMTGWRIGFAVGNAEMIGALGKFKSNMDSGIFTAVQRAGITALRQGDAFCAENVKMYRERRDCLCEGLKSIGLEFKKPRATFYVWISTPKGMSAVDTSSLLLDKADIVATPGTGFGKSGEGYFRIALTVGCERLREAVERIRKVL